MSYFENQTFFTWEMFWNYWKKYIRTWSYRGPHWRIPSRRGGGGTMWSNGAVEEYTVELNPLGDHTKDFILYNIIYYNSYLYLKWHYGAGRHVLMENHIQIFCHYHFQSENHSLLFPCRFVDHLWTLLMECPLLRLSNNVWNPLLSFPNEML
jgi:hypothetical protein